VSESEEECGRKANFARDQMNASVCSAKDYENSSRQQLAKNQPNCRPAAGNPKPDTLNPKQRGLNESDCVKQSQFPEDDIYISIYTISTYEHTASLGRQKTKPIKANFETPSHPARANCSGRAKNEI